MSQCPICYGRPRSGPRAKWVCKYCFGAGRHKVGCRCKNKPHLRLHIGPYGWWVAGPKGRGWNYPQSHQAVRDYIAFVGL